jgi:hypothetical protein
LIAILSLVIMMLTAAAYGRMINTLIVFGSPGQFDVVHRQRIFLYGAKATH